MDSLPQILFWCTAGLLFHNFIGFDLSIRLLTLLRSELKLRKDGELPTISVLIPAHNEERYIGETLEKVLDQQYPDGRRSIVVASDNSTDRTNTIVREYEGRGVRLIAFSKRHGKIGALDEVIPTLESEVVVILDANVRLAPNSLKELAAAYIDPRIGAASGFETVELPEKKTPLRDEVVYREQEARLKERLSRLGMMVGAFGGFYSIRRECFRPIGPLPMQDDVIIPLQPVAQGKYVVYRPGAVCYEAIGERISDEFQRRIRMTAYNLNAISRMLSLAAKGGLLSLYVVISYKLLRWFSPYLWVASLILTFYLAPKNPLFAGVAAVYGVVLFLGLSGFLLHQFDRRIGVISSIYYFLLMNIASFLGFARWLRGTPAYWQHRGF